MEAEKGKQQDHRSVIKERYQKQQEALKWLCECFPESFSFKDPKPLKLNILEDIFKSLPEERFIARIHIRRALKFYTHRLKYLEALQAKTHRVDLTGKAVEEIIEGHKSYAAEVSEKKKAYLAAHSKKPFRTNHTKATDKKHTSEGESA